MLHDWIVGFYGVRDGERVTLVVAVSDHESEIMRVEQIDDLTFVPASGMGEFGEYRRLPRHLFASPHRQDHVLGQDRLRRIPDANHEVTQLTLLDRVSHIGMR